MKFKKNGIYYHPKTDELMVFGWEAKDRVFLFGNCFFANGQVDDLIFIGTL